MKKTQKLKHNYESSESSDDESLLAVARKKRRSCKVAEKYRINVDNPLCDVRQEACEFCDRTFSNRLQSLVHNSKHIIIPLIKCDASQPLHKQRSTSPVKELPKFNNKIILGKKKMNNTSLRDRIVFDDDDPDVIVLSDTDSIEENKIKGISKEVAKLKPDNNENILNSFVSDCRVILDDTISLISTIEPDEDIIVNQHHNNDTSQLGNNLNNHHIQGKATVFSQERGLMDTKSIDNIEDKVYSVHNDELLRTAPHYCEFCHRAFPNSFAYTTHKARHLYVKIEPIFVDLPNSSLVSTLLPIATKKKTITCSEKPVKQNSFDENYFFKIPAHPDHTNKICNATNHKQNRTCKKMTKRGNFKKKRMTPCLKCDIKIFRSLSGDNVGTIHSGISNGTQKAPVAIPELANTLQRLSLDNGFMLQDSEEPECVLGF